jgi:hypothetical protein
VHDRARFQHLPPEEAGATTSTDGFALTSAAANSRAGRYLNRPASAPARQVTNQELYRLSRLREVGDVAKLVLQFGEYRGVTLFQVAQSDPDYLRCLRLPHSGLRSARRPCNSCVRSKRAKHLLRDAVQRGKRAHDVKTTGFQSVSIVVLATA